VTSEVVWILFNCNGKIIPFWILCYNIHVSALDPFFLALLKDFLLLPPALLLDFIFHQ
jgi:hypothetical protein